MITFFNEGLFGLSADVLNWIILLLLVVAAVLLIWFVIRMITRPRLASGRRSQKARLAITDAAQVDDRRRIVLVRRDEVEHLIMIGGANDLVIEADIRKSQPRSQNEPGRRPATAAAITPVAPQPAAVPAPPKPITTDAPARREPVAAVQDRTSPPRAPEPNASPFPHPPEAAAKPRSPLNDPEATIPGLTARRD